MRLELQARRTRRTISLTPLIDVVFILLLFFLVASHFNSWRALPLNTPTAIAGEVSGDDAPAVLLRAHADGSLDLNGEPLDPALLIPTLETHRARHPDLSVVLQSDPDLKLQTLVSVMDGIAAAGVQELSLR